MGAVRRLAAILAVDVVGYSRLMGDDEAGTLRAVQVHREAARALISDKGGRIVKTMGDGLLLEFPSVVAAMECALGIQIQMVERNRDVPEDKRIVYRIGVHIGDVLVDGDDIYGDGVNVAARLEALCEPGGVCLSASAHENVRGRVEAEFIDLGEQALKNIARPVRVFATGPLASKSKAPEASMRQEGRPRLSILVLPFMNIGGGVDQEHFADGVTESLTVDLSHIRGSFVIARNTAFTLKGKPIDVRALGREMNVRYVVEGSIQRGGDRARVIVQLIDADTSNNIWAERFDRPVSDIFYMQDEIVARLAGALNSELITAEARRASRVSDPDAIDLYFQGMSSFNKGWAPDNLAQARDFFDRALQSDPDFIDALIGSGIVDVTVGCHSLVSDSAKAIGSGEAKLIRGLLLAPNHARAHMSLGLAMIFSKRALQGIAECEYALAIDRNLAHAHAAIGMGKIHAGESEAAEAHIVEALRLSPRDPLAFTWMMTVGIAEFHLGRYESAIAWFRRSVGANRNYPYRDFMLSSALAHLGQLVEARSAVRSGLALDPTFTVSRIYAARATRSDNTEFLAGLARLIDGMRLAGAPE